MDISATAMEATRIARWGKVKPYEQTFIESKIPGYDKKLYKLINRGVLENAGVHPAIQGEHRFGVSMIEIPVGQGANLHSHLTEEVFCPLNGTLEVFWGEKGENTTILNQWDVFSVPVNVMRGFRNLSDHTLVVYSIVGGTDKEVGRITWDPEVLVKAKATGLEFDENGFLRDTSKAGNPA